jgi:hypothetical protein
MVKHILSFFKYRKIWNPHYTCIKYKTSFMKPFIPKISVCILIVIFSPFYIKAQPDLTWAKQLGTDQEEYVMNHTTDGNGNIYVCGKTKGSLEGTNKGNFDCFIMKLDINGNLLWKRQFGTQGDENEQWCASDRMGNIYVTGSTTGNLEITTPSGYPHPGGVSGKEDVFIVKYDAGGNHLWTVQCGSDSADIGQSVVIDGENLFVAGTTSGNFGNASLGKSDCFLMKIGTQGNAIWIKQFGTSADDNASGISVNGKSIHIGGNTWGEMGGKNAGFMDCFTAEFDMSGNAIQFNQFGTDGFDIAMNMVADEQGLFVCGSTSGALAGDQKGEGDAFVVSLQKSGGMIWKSQFGTNLHDGARSIAMNSSFPDLVLISGVMHLPPAQAFIRAYKKNGEFQWEKAVSDLVDKTNTSGKDVDIDSSGRITHVGLTSAPVFGPLIGVTDFYITRFQTE